MIRFDAPRDRRVQVTSRIVLGGLAAIAAGVVFLGLALSRGEPELLWPFLFCPVIIAVVVGATYLLAPRGFVILDRELVVERRLRPLRIELSAIRVVGLLPVERIAGAVRLGGSGGLFGYFGWYFSRRLGAFRIFATTRWSGLVLVETETEALVLSPGNPDAFTEALRARAPAARREWTGDSSSRPRRFPTARLLRSVGLTLAVVLVLVTSLFALVWGLAPVAAQVTAKAVRVERRWAPALELPLAGVRDAEVMAPPYAQRWWRTNGTAIGQVRYGRFVSRELGPFRLFAWRYGPYVLLETDEGRVVLTPDEPERFVAEVREQLGAR